jgi:serine/threonine-protein kinase
MEHVEGADLRRLLEEEGPLPAEEAVELARELTEGLAHAHENGVVHRDLKTENVLLDLAGKPRLADFGLARSEGRDFGAEDLTAEGQVMGTLRAMAPEQILGEGADARTDLYALGVLLAEMLTGGSPFEAESRRATVARVLAGVPEPLAGVDAPPELVALVESLLERDPLLRPRSAGEVAARLASIAAGRIETELAWSSVEELPSSSLVPPAAAGKTRGLALGRLALGGLALGLMVLALLFLVGRYRAVPEPVHVAVRAPVVEGVEEEEGQVLAFAVRSAVLRGLGELERVSVVGTAEVDAVPEGASVRQLASATAADQVFLSTARCGLGDCWLDLSRFDGATGESLWTRSLQMPRAEPQVISWATEEAVVGGLPERKTVGLEAMPVELLAELLHLRLAEGQESFFVEPKTVYERLDLLRRRFGAYRDLEVWRARAALAVFVELREESWRDRALVAIDSARSLDPSNPRTRFVEAEIHLAAGQIEQVEKVLRDLEKELPGDAYTEELRARVWMAQGETARALETMGKLTARRPSWNRLLNLARMAAGVGKIDLALSTLAQLEERAPNHRAGRRLRANLELKYGDLDRAAALYETLAVETPSLSVWSNLGLVNLLRRDAAAALEALGRAREMAPGNPMVLLNLADGYTLAGDEEAATALYSEVLERLEKGEAGDPQLLTTRAQARARLGRKTEAVADVEMAIRQAPDNPAVRFEAALVYSLVGDLTSAERNRRLALDLGFEERWFTLAAFDP